MKGIYIKKVYIILFYFFFSVFVLTVFPQQQELDNRFLLAQSYERTGDFERAKSIYLDLLKVQPHNYQYFTALNRVYIQLKEYETSISLLNEKLKLMPQDINLYGLLGSTYYLIGDENEAYRVWNSAIENVTQSHATYRVLANYALERRAFDIAIDFLNKGKTSAPDPIFFATDLANIYAATMRYKEATEEYCFILSKDPNQLKHIESRIMTYAARDEAMAATISVVQKYADGKNLSFSYLLAHLYMQSNNFTKAFELYLDIDSKQKNQGAEIFNFAQKAFNEGYYDEAVKAYDEILKRYPQSPFVSNARLGYARTFEAKLERADEKFIPSWKSYFVFTSPNRDKYLEAIEAYKKLTDLYSKTEVGVEALYRIGTIYFHKLNDISQAEFYFRKVIDEFPLSVFTVFSSREMGNISLLNDELDTAYEFYRNVISNRLTSDTERNIARYKSARILFFQNKFNEANNILSEIKKDLRDNTANDAIEFSLLLNTAISDSATLTLYAKAELLADQKKFGEAKKVYREVASMLHSFVLNPFARIKQAEMELAQNQFEPAIQLLESISNELEKNIFADKALFLAGNTYQFALNDYPKAIEIYEILLAKFPNSFYLDYARLQINYLRTKLS